MPATWCALNGVVRLVRSYIHCIVVRVSSCLQFVYRWIASFTIETGGQTDHVISHAACWLYWYNQQTAWWCNALQLPWLKDAMESICMARSMFMYVMLCTANSAHVGCSYNSLHNCSVFRTLQHGMMGSDISLKVGLSFSRGGIIMTGFTKSLVFLRELFYLLQ